MMNEEFKEIVSDFEALRPLSLQGEVDNAPEHDAEASQTTLDVSNQELSRKLDEMTKKYEQLDNRCKRLAEARDALSKQVSELRKKVDEYEELNLQGTTEAIKLLSKLVDEESLFRSEARKNNNFLPPGHNPYNRHNQFVNLFLKLMVRSEK